MQVRQLFFFFFVVVVAGHDLPAEGGEGAVEGGVQDDVGEDGDEEVQRQADGVDDGKVGDPTACHQEFGTFRPSFAVVC